MSHLADESKVLVIYTGGTIGMLVGRQGYVPEPYFLTETLLSQTRFHDPLQDSLFSNAASVERFREWSSGSGRSTPHPKTPPETPDSVNTVPRLPPNKLNSLLVRSSRPIGTLSTSLQLPDVSSARGQPSCVRVTENVYEAYLPSLVTPPSTVPGGHGSKSIRYAVLEWNPLLDSSNIDIQDWVRISSEIELNYTFDAFVILHGTDTMAYTASALSFMLEDLGKTVILTGAQIPLSQLRNDAVDNLMGALTIAGHYILPECCLYFNHTLFRGNRVSKVSSYDLNAFNSPNFPPLVDVGIDIVVNWNDVIRQTSLRRFRAHKKMSPDVATLRLFPGITPATVAAFFMPPVRGVVLETFGAGNSPQRPELMQVIKDACTRGVVVVAISQCIKGTVSDAYETGRALINVGVVPGGDMTPECALTKLSYLLSKTDLGVDEVRRLMGTPLRGELTRPSAMTSSEPASMKENVENINSIIAQMVQLSSQTANKQSVPEITISDDAGITNSQSQELTAPWSWTVAEAASTESVLLPFLLHLAVAKNDVKAIKFCLQSVHLPGLSGENPMSPSSMPTETQFWGTGGGLANCLEQGSGRSPLQIAALNSSTEAAELLLQWGALVHLRDGLGHTALYYAARQRSEDIVNLLVQAGASLGGLDENFAVYAVRDANAAGDERAIRIWTKAGLRCDDAQLNKDSSESNI